MNGCPVAAAWADACWAGEVSQHPMCPHWAHRRRCTHHPWAASHSTHPVPLGGTDGSIPAVSLIDLSVVLVDHDAEADVESQAGSLTHRLGREERLEYPVLDLRRHPRPGVAE